MIPLPAIVRRFAFPRGRLAIVPLGRGLINDSWLVTASRKRGVLQRINRHVFPEPDRIMANIATVARHLAARPDRRLRLPTLIAARAGGNFVRAGGEFWRLWHYLPAVTLERVDHPDLAFRLGWSLGHLHRLLAEIDPADLYDTLPGFHVTPTYLDAFDQALAARQDAFSPALERACDFVQRRRERAAVLERANLPLRVIHGDPKLDNVLFDPESLRPLAWVDLDTLKPGLWLWDIGDCVRSACGAEGSLDLSLTAALLDGWLAEAGRWLTEAEIGLLPEAIWLLPFELGLRFLTDHLQGDRYFKVGFRGENLRRALAQFALTEDIERQWGDLLGLRPFRRGRRYSST